MKRQRGLPQDKQWLVLQFLKLSPTERLRYAIGLVDSALRVNPDMLKHRVVLTARGKPRGRHR
jgi:hypothetical protein